MKLNTLLFIIVVAVLSLGTVNAQETICGTDYFLEKEYQKDPSFQNVVEQNWAQSDVPAVRPEGARAVSIIPVVFHVFHNNGEGNISYEQVQSAIDMLNEDFRRTNADAVNTRAIFAPYATDSEIEFRLATIDPNGQCTNGVVRIDDPNASYDAGNDVKSLSYWSSSQYFNVWVVNNIESGGVNGIILGYAQFPGSGSWNTYGVVIRNDRVGTVGTAATGDRTLTHEVGHCLNLLHTFQSGCGSSCQSSGDRVCDTPPVNSSTQGCATTQNQCSNDAVGNSVYSTDVVDQIENYMSYDDCQNMYTIGQKSRMQSSLSNFNNLAQLTSTANLNATGVLNTSLGVCKAEFEVSNQVICVGQSIQFTDLSYFNPETYNWSFEGGYPAVSHVKNPAITYDTPGVYEVELNIIDSSNASVTTSKTNYITVLSSEGNTAPFTESFETNGSLESIEWFPFMYDNGFGWSKNGGGAASGSYALKANGYSYSGSIDVTSPAYDVSNLTSATVSFKYAYAQKTGGNNNYIRAYVSADCGATWRLKWVNGGANLSTAPDMSGAYTSPAAQDWVSANFTISGVDISENLRLRFEFRADEGNNLFLDDININGVLSDHVVLRSPSNGAANLSVNQTLNWNATSVVDDYTVEFDTDTNFNSSNLISQQIPYISNSSNNMDTELDVTNLIDGQTYYWRVKTTSNGTSSLWSDTWSFTVDASATGITDVDNNEAKVTVYPNPVSQKAHLTVDAVIPENMIITMYDITGNAVQYIHEGQIKTGKTHFVIQRNGLSQGIYLIQTRTPTKSQTVRVVFN